MLLVEITGGDEQAFALLFKKVRAFLRLHFLAGGSCDASSKSGDVSDTVCLQRPKYLVIAHAFFRIQPVNTHVTIQHIKVTIDIAS